MAFSDTHSSSFVMILLLFCFAVIHSGGAALRGKAERVIGAREGNAAGTAVSLFVAESLHATTHHSFAIHQTFCFLGLSHLHFISFAIHPCNLKKRQTLNGRLPPEDSSVFDDSVCVLIVMT